MNENNENSGNDFFYGLLDNPADLSHSDAFNLQLLINDYPQSSLLRSMLSVKREEERIHAASAYVSPKLLYKIANNFGSLPEVADDQVVFCETQAIAKPVHNTVNTVDIPNLNIDESNYFHVPIDNDVVYLEEDETEEIAVDDEVAEDVANGEQQIEATEEGEVAGLVDDHDQDEVADVMQEETEPEQNVVAENHGYEEMAEEADTADELAAEEDDQKEIAEETVAADELTTEEAVDEEQEQVAIADDVHEEMAEEADTSDELTTEEVVDEEQEHVAATESDEVIEQEAVAHIEEHTDAANDLTTDDEYTTQIDEVAYALSNIGEKPVHPHQEINDDVFEEIVSIEDIGIEQLAIMDKANEEHESDNADEAGAEPEEETENSYKVFEPTLPEDEERRITTGTEGKAGERVTRYNDEKMPYSFMWWLDKTRKEHAAVYQPFVEGKAKTPVIPPVEKPQPAADHLQQQYMANILTVSTVVSELNLTPPKVETPPPPADGKVDKIIERFIQEEPQIKHPAKAKLDNENKAKKSSEDRDELVTETLARIYTEQMLYHKAILTYKKLMLKFPEKSLYFAGQIEQLEKKIN